MSSLSGAVTSLTLAGARRIFVKCLFLRSGHGGWPTTLVLGSILQESR